ncbi:FHA domain-containing protein [Mycolicibacterium sp. CBMA 226]|uniref:FHA domain-containing protein n=1 Tax=Mycolicibacterium sp. CBMA 226 TaxID=2606611 RepID=UPI0012DC6A81|nr:FHA domain-containing protein [Mycolicibacterium sp. CBMA 226]MUL77531.1 ATP-binding cassette domain-containing protein [Mycolicibacterium sp. CBMA 226]
MSPSAPGIVVRYGEIARLFPSDRDVIVGRDVRADVRIPHPGVSRVHLVLRCLNGRWIALDDNSSHGTYVGRQRVSSVPLHNGTVITLGDPRGPRLVFEHGPAPDERPTKDQRISRPVTIGRDAGNNIVVNDVLVSRRHARLVHTPTGTRLEDARSSNGTFVNGVRVMAATLRDNDVVTIGKSDFVFSRGELVQRGRVARTLPGLRVRDAGLTLKAEATVLLDPTTFDAKPGTLTAIIGPSGAGKSTLLKLLAGLSAPTVGSVNFDGHDLHTDYAALRGRIGMVAQDDLVHGRLTVAQALDTTARLRMPPDTTKVDRQHVIAQVLAELDMSAHSGKRVDQLSGGQRKRVSVAMELLTEPSLLVLDEPTTGLDPALDRQVMALLRRLADAGRVIVVVTHSLTFLDECDQVLLLAPGGKTAYCGPPAELRSAMGSTDWADVFNGICADPVGAQRRFMESRGTVAIRVPTPVAEHVVSKGTPSRTSLSRQFAAIVQRQTRLLMGDRRYLALLLLAPLMVGLLPLVVGGHAGFGKPPANSEAPLEPRQIIVLLSFAAILLGITLSVRDLISERAIHKHEQAAGLSSSAYLSAKICVFGAVAALQSALLVLLITAPKIGKPAPTSAVVLGVPVLELYLDVAATSVVAMILGLVISSLSRSSNQYVPLMVIACISQLVFAGSFIPIAGRPAMEVVAGMMPARWGVAAMASTVDLTNLAPVGDDGLWRHSASTWLVDMAMLGILAVVFAGFVRWRLRRTTDM